MNELIKGNKAVNKGGNINIRSRCLKIFMSKHIIRMQNEKSLNCL